jgi:hypothetical protein
MRSCWPPNPAPSWRTAPCRLSRLLIQYIRSYPPSATWGRAIQWWQGTQLTSLFFTMSCWTRIKTPQLEDHPLSAVRNCLFSIFAAIPHTWRASPSSVTWGRAILWWKGTHLTWSELEWSSQWDWNGRGHVAQMGKKRNAYRILVGEPEGKRPLGRPRRK